MDSTAVATKKNSLEPRVADPSVGARRRALVSSIPLSLVLILWMKMTIDAWRLRVIIAEYESVHGRPDPTSFPVLEPFRTLHDQLIAVGADYFYPFGPLVLVAAGLLWIGLAALLASRWHAVRNVLIIGGLLAILVQQWFLGQSLLTYTDVTT